jgi:hypothetical protein
MGSSERTLKLISRSRGEIATALGTIYGRYQEVAFQGNAIKVSRSFYILTLAFVAGSFILAVAAEVLVAEPLSATARVHSLIGEGRYAEAEMAARQLLADADSTSDPQSAEMAGAARRTGCDSRIPDASPSSY